MSKSKRATEWHQYQLAVSFVSSREVQIIRKFKPTKLSLDRIRKHFHADGVRIVQHINVYGIEPEQSHKMTPWQVVKFPARYANRLYAATRKCQYCGEEQLGVEELVETPTKLHATCSYGGTPEKHVFLTKYLRDDGYLFHVNQFVQVAGRSQGRILAFRMTIATGRVDVKLSSGKTCVAAKLEFQPRAYYEKHFEDHSH